MGFSAEKFAEKSQLWLAIAPEGTRHGAENWKTGFYWIAHRAEVPILIVGFDYQHREINILGTFTPTGDVEHDLPQIIGRYKGIKPAHPERLSQPLRHLSS